MPVGKPLHLRLFVEGEEIPVISAQISINTSAPATASIQVIPLDSAMDMLPRTMVHLFFLDTKVDTSIGPRKVDEQGNLRGVYRLLFSGEIVGFAYSQTPASRGLVLQCLDFSNYWDSANVMAISYGPGGNAFTNDGSLNGGALGTFTDIPGDSAAEKLVTWVKSHPVTEGLKGIGGLAGGVIHIMEAMGGVPGHFKGVNDFYTIAELRCRLLNQITAEENDSTAARVLSVNVFHEWLKNGIEQAGGNITFRDVMKLLFQYIYYEFVPNPAPKFDNGVKVPVTGPVSLKSDPIIVKVITALGFVRDSLVADVAGNKKAHTELLQLAQKYQDFFKGILNDLKKYGNKSGAVTKAKGFVKQAVSAITKFQLTDTVSPDAFKAAAKACNQALEALNEGTIPGTTGKSFSSQRLRTQIVRPDCWFSSPPACNVIFPETYAQLSYDRNYLQETTRLLVHTFDTLVGREHLLAHHILSPYVGLDAQKLAKYKGSKSFRVLMDHEIHVGIIPKTEWIPNTAGISQSLDSEQMKKVKDGRLSWTIKASLFHFFKYRFGARQVSVAGRFNPFLVCGFPGVVITRPYNINGGAVALQKAHGSPDSPVPLSEINDVINDHADEFHAPSHFIGMIGGIQHSIDQSGGTTSATLHHARKHRGIDDEFIGILINTDEGQATRIVKVLIDIDTAESLPDTRALNLLLGVTPQTVESQPAPAAGKKPVKLKAASSSKPVQKVSVDPRTKVLSGVKDALSVLGSTPTQPTVDEQFEAVFGTTQVSEQDSNQKQSTAKKFPERTTRGSIPEVNRTDILVPMGSTKIKVNDKKGLYGGKIVGIEVLDANVVPVSFFTTSKVQQFNQVSDDETAAAFNDSPGFEDLRRSTTIKKTTKTQKTNKKGVAFSKVAVYEEISVAVSGTLPIEEVLRPSWFSTAYANANIGKKIYQPFFGCGAVVDGLKVGGTAPEGADSSPDSEPVDAETSVGDLMKRLQAEEASKRANSIEKALNILGYEYGQVKAQGMDVDSFVRDYTDRPIATYQEIFGDSDLKFTITDSAVGGDAQVKQITVNGVKKTPMVGFHTGATHRDLATKGKLTGLTTDLQLGFKRVDGIGKDEPLVTRYDVRPAKKEKVLKYIEELGLGPGFRGG